jgi:predicted nucleic acid-binding protein
MSNLVADSGVVVKWFVPEPLAIEAGRIYTDFQQGTLTILAPDLLYAEVGNIVWKKHVLQGMPAASAEDVLKAVFPLPFVVTPSRDLYADAYRLAVTYKRTVYDALYLALAQREQCPFVTADQRLANAVSGHLTNVVWLGRWP